MKKTYVKPELSRRGVLSVLTAVVTDSGTTLTSDIRLKTGIERAGVASNGLPLYDFSYIGGDAVYRGVMAQDVLERFPEAVRVMPNGYLAVRYDMLGLEMKRLN